MEGPSLWRENQGTPLSTSNQQPEPDEQAANQAALHIIRIIFSHS